MTKTFNLITTVTVLKGRHCDWRYLNDIDAEEFAEEFEADRVEVPGYLDPQGITEYLQKQDDARYEEHRRQVSGGYTIHGQAMHRSA
jgi:hypothetical protein